MAIRAFRGYALQRRQRRLRDSGRRDAHCALQLFERFATTRPGREVRQVLQENELEWIVREQSGRPAIVLSEHGDSFTRSV